MAIQKEKRSSAMSAFLKAKDDSTRVLGKVERYVMARKLSVPSGRRDNWIHPSQMVSKYWCHRASFFHILGKEPAKQPTNLSKELVFEQGHRIHDIWQTWFGQMGNLYGRWECEQLMCKNSWWDTSPSNCPMCNGPWIKYKEVPLESKEYMITGHADGWLKGFGDDLLLEVKSIGVGSFRYYSGNRGFTDADFADAWKNLDTPFESHISQAQVYMKLLEIMGVDNPPQEALFIYESKVNQEVKEFVIPKSNFGITELFDAAKMIVECLENKRPPICNISGPQGCNSCKEYFYDEV